MQFYYCCEVVFIQGIVLVNSEVVPKWKADANSVFWSQ